MKVLSVAVAVTALCTAFAAAAETPNRPAEPRPLLQAAVPAPEALDATAAIHALLADPDFRRAAARGDGAWDFGRPETIPGFGSIRPSDYAVSAASLPVSDE